MLAAYLEDQPAVDRGRLPVRPHDIGRANLRGVPVLSSANAGTTTVHVALSIIALTGLFGCATARNDDDPAGPIVVGRHEDGRARHRNPRAGAGPQLRLRVWRRLPDRSALGFPAITPIALLAAR